jgi:hypothetical protein
MNAFRTSSIALGMLLFASPLALAHESHAQNHAQTIPSATQSESHASSQGSGITQEQAMREIRLDGYTNVQDLKKTSKGWTAKAKEGDHQVSLLVDSRGNVEKTRAGS